ncbi:MAG: hypothetical protein EP343_11580 [Deltaproteobacteria bacterium]|nr:MAG: hypothetical protein EP343_11580 [Deltaproteobacteria bacterium]
MRQMGLWMGIFWIAIGLFLLISQWTGQAQYPIPKLNINLGWVIVALGAWRIWWWWKTTEEPHRRRLAFEKERRQMELELDRQIREREVEEASRQSEETKTNSSER